MVKTKKKLITKKSKTATIIVPKTKQGTIGWLDGEGIDLPIVLFKRVSIDFKTQEGTIRETVWTIGTTLTHPNWSPKEEECGSGKFHACSRPYFCDEFRSEKNDDRYVAISVEKKDLYAWPQANYPHKIAFRKGTVLYECDKFGEKLKGD